MEAKIEMNASSENTVQIGNISGGNNTFNFGQLNDELGIVPYMNKENSKSIIGLCKAIDVHLIKVGTTLLKNPSMYNNEHLVSNDFIGWLSKLKEFINGFQMLEISVKSNLTANNPLTLFARYILMLSPDVSVDLNAFYYERIVHIVNCIYEYNDKTNEYYIAIGVLGMAKDHSDEKIYECVMSDLRTFFTMAHNILDVHTKNIDYSKAENITSDAMCDNIYHRIRACFNNESKHALMILLERGKMIDTDLAREVNIDVLSLRKALFPATKSFLYYKYRATNSTEIWIQEPYKTAILKYYDKLFLSDDTPDNSFENDLDRLFESEGGI